MYDIRDIESEHFQNSSKASCPLTSTRVSGFRNAMPVSPYLPLMVNVILDVDGISLVGSMRQGQTQI